MLQHYEEFEKVPHLWVIAFEVPIMIHIKRVQYKLHNMKYYYITISTIITKSFELSKKFYFNSVSDIISVRNINP